MGQEDRIFTDADLKVIGQFFEVIFQAAKRNGMLGSVNSDAPKEAAPKQERIIPLTEWPKYYEWPTVASLRAMIFSSNTNGSDFFVRRAGRRVLICEKSFFKWCDMSQNERIKASPDATRWQQQFGKR